MKHSTVLVVCVGWMYLTASVYGFLLAPVVQPAWFKFLIFLAVLLGPIVFIAWSDIRRDEMRAAKESP